MNRIYVEIAAKDLRSKDRGRCYLAYLLIRLHTKKTAGGFNLEKFLSAVELKPRAGSALLKSLVSRGFVKKESSTHYRVVGHRSFCQYNGRQTFYCIKDSELLQYDLKHIASFRAFLAEIEVERYKRHQKALVKGYRRINERDGHREVVKNETYGAFHQLMACECTAKLIGVSTSTACNYRKRQSVSLYEFSPIFIKPEIYQRGFEGKEMDYYTMKGKFFSYGGNLYLFPISRRLTSIHLKRA